jgi:hypothetical protein
VVADAGGLDYGGLAREWFYLLSIEVFDPRLGMFVSSHAGVKREEEGSMGLGSRCVLWLLLRPPPALLLPF